MPQLSVFRKGQDLNSDGLRKSISAHHDLLAACPMLSLDKQVRTHQQQQQSQKNSFSASSSNQNKSMRTSKSDVLLSAVNFPRSDGSMGCTQFGSCQIKSAGRVVGSNGSAATTSTGATTSGVEALRKNSSSILSRIHALTTQKCLQISHSKSLLTPRGPSSSTAFLPSSASRSSMASRCSAASFRLANCRLCLCDIPSAEFYELSRCGCTFCKQCVQQYVKIQILDGNITIPCPDGQCSKKGVIGILEVELLANEDLYNKYKRFKLNTEVDLDQNRTWCPTPGCETICAVTTSLGGGKWQAVPISCPTCSRSYCASCKVEWQSEHACKVYMKKKPAWFLGSDDRIVFTEGQDAPIKHCPVCRIPIERDSGCAQMMCKKCKHVFCWYCLTSLDDDFLLRHYDKGPCKDKLGHSRASVIWHRAQVIGIFAGVGLLLLLASPLLIITAPFIMCCKCKTCDRCHDSNADPNLPPVNL